MEFALVNIGYLFMLSALAVRDVLWLRGILIAGQILLLWVAAIQTNQNVMFWYCLFLAINIIRFITTLNERKPVPVPAELEDLYRNVFSNMSSREFLYFWETGTRKETTGELVHEGQSLDELSLILAGSVEVVKGSQVIATLYRGKWFAEMSFLTQAPASATVRTVGKAVIMAWEQEKLRHLKALNPGLLIKLQEIFGKDLVWKLQAKSAQRNK